VTYHILSELEGPSSSTGADRGRPQEGERIGSLCFLCAAVFLARDAHYALLSLDGALAKIDSTAAELQRTSKLVADYVEKQKAVLESPRNQKALEAGWQMAAVLNGTARDINRLIVPRVMRTMDGLSTAVGNFNDSAQALTELVRNADHSLNQDLLPNLAETAKTLGVSMQTVTTSLQSKRPLFPGSAPGGVAACFVLPEFTGAKGGQAWQSDEQHG